jgi:hypothetical protein
MSTSYLDIIQGHWDSILALYMQFADKNPVMLFDLDQHQIHAYPYEEFKAQLSRKSQRELEQQYRRALEKDYMVIFVRDEAQKQLTSFSLAIEEA